MLSLAFRPPATPSRFEPFGLAAHPLALDFSRPGSRCSLRVPLPPVARVHRPQPHCSRTHLTSAARQEQLGYTAPYPGHHPWEANRSPPIPHACLPTILTLITPAAPVRTPCFLRIDLGCATPAFFRTDVGLPRLNGGSPTTSATSGELTFRAGRSPAGLRTPCRQRSPAQVLPPALSSTSGPNRINGPGGT